MASILMLQEQIFPNLGIAYLCGAAKSRGHGFHLHVGSFLSPEIIEKIRRLKPDLIGFSCMTGMERAILAQARAIKQHFDVKIVFGGPQPHSLRHVRRQKPALHEMTGQRRFALIDRDGTINVERDYLSDPGQLELIPGAAQGLRRLRELGLGLAVITNQSGIARGYFTPERLEAIHARLGDLLAAEDVALDGLYICPHGPDEACDCRKPLPGMVLRAATELNFDPRRAFVIGDKEADVNLGKAVGATSILVRTGYGRSHEAKCRPDHVADDLLGAAEWVALQLKEDGGN